MAISEYLAAGQRNATIAELMNLGARCPPYSCAPGKAMVAALPEEEREELIGAIRFKQFTPTITTRKRFRDELVAAQCVGGGQCLVK